MRITASPRPAAAGDPSSRVRSSAGLGFGQTRQLALDHFGKDFARRRQGLRRDRAAAGALPRLEEHFEDSMQELPLLPRIHDVGVFRLLVETQDVLREKLERAAQIDLDRAHRPGPIGRLRRWRRDRPARPAAIGAIRCSAHSRASGVERIQDHRIGPQRRVRSQSRGGSGFPAHDRQTRARDLVELHRPHHDRFVVQHDRRHRDAPGRRREQIDEAGVRRPTASTSPTASRAP